MKNYLKHGFERVVSLSLAMIMLFSCVSLADPAQAADVPVSDYTFGDYTSGYHLTEFLNGYNVLAFGNALMDKHCMGSLLIQGYLDGGDDMRGYSDGINLPPSYIKGLILAPNAVYNSRNDPDAPPLYVGSVNTVTTTSPWGSENYYSVNGIASSYSGQPPIYVSDDFFNFDEAYKVIKADQATMQSRGRVVTPVNEVITINVGDNVIIESLQGVREINIIGDLNAQVNTTINVLDGGDVNVPTELINGSQPTVKEQNDDGTAIVFSFPNAESVKLPTQNWVGHVIAPDADVAQESGNFNGCIICKNLYSGAEGHIYSYNTTDTSWDTVYSVEKVWNDGHDADGLRPDSIQVQLLANGQPYGTPVTLTAVEGWYYVWPVLPEKDANGKTIVYSVKEINVPAGYTSTYDPANTSLINRHDYKEVDITVTKKWVGEPTLFQTRPVTLTVYLYADGVKIDEKTITVTDAATQSVTFTDLPKNKDGKAIVYSVEESQVPGYIGTASADANDPYKITLTNTWNVESTQVSGTKTWNDDSNRDGLRPAEITVELLADGQVIHEHVAKASDGWKYSFTNLPKTDANGKTIVYTVREKTVPTGYTVRVDGYNLINDHKIETVDLSGAKTWNDDDNNDGKRPTEITVILRADLVEVARKTVTAKDGWKWEFKGMPKNYAGKAIHYTVEELTVDGYTSVRSGMNLTNTHENETVDISGSKTWADDNNNDGKRPDSIVINLLQDGKAYKTVTVTEKDGWKWSFTGLPKYTDGHEHVYTITENPVADYTTTVNGYNVTNTHINETVDLLGLKVWNDNNNNDGKRPNYLTVYLTRDGQRTGEYRTTNAQNNWYWMFADLPKYEDGHEFVYGFEEEAVKDYTGPVTTQMTTLPQGYGDIGYTLTNTHTDELVEIKGAKTWDDANNQDGKRPDSITIHLWKTVKSTAQDSHVKVASKTVTAADNWAWDFGKLPKYEGGKEVLYTITEDVVPGYSTQINGYDVTNRDEPSKITVSGVKHWVDGNDQDGIRPESITIRLHKEVNGVKTENFKVMTVKPDANGSWSWAFTDLDEFEAGKKIAYTITEDQVEGYTTVIDQYDAINTHITETVEVSGVKTWNDVNNQDGKRPQSIIIRLWKTVDGKTAQVRTSVVTASHDWRWSFVELPKYEAGKLITYTITEDAVAGYTTEINGFNAENTHKTETVDIEGTKTWNDANNQDGKRPAEITVNLWATVGSSRKEVREVKVTEADGWKWSFTGLPKYEGGKEITYTITEDAVPGYSTEINGYDITNTDEPSKINVSGVKHWVDANNQDGIRPASITINLLADGVEVAQKVVTEQDGWKWNFTNLDEYKAGKKIVYTITEDPVQGYVTVIGEHDVINTHETETVDISGEKTWVDANNQDGMRPARITIYLNKRVNGVETRVRMAVPTAANGWKWSFVDMPKYENGVEIEYFITEEPVPGYTAVISGYDVTNTHETETVDISGSKTWNHDVNPVSEHPASITINLWATVGSSRKEVRKVTVTEADGWTWSFTDLPKYEGGKLITYTITEDHVTDYSTKINGYDVTNTYTHGSLDISGVKYWVDNNDQDGIRPDSITIRLHKEVNGVKTESFQVKTVTPDANGVWSWEFTGLDTKENGVEIIYTITEDPVEGYETVIDEYDAINTHETETVDISGEKTWVDANNQDGMRPSRITIYLYKENANGQDELVRTAVPTAANGWKWSFVDLPKNENGQPISYYITEEPVPGYTSEINGYDVTNTHVTKTVDIEGSKTWNDFDNQDGKRPSSITVHLWATVGSSHTEVDKATVTAADNWKWSFTDKPMYEGGKEIIYTITEDVVPGYSTDININTDVPNEIAVSIINTDAPSKINVSGMKHWVDANDQDGKRPERITIYLLADGVKVAEKVVTEQDGWKWNFTNLDEYKAGTKIVYTIDEKPVPEYTTVIDRYDVINTHETETLDLLGQKIWDDNNNNDGMRPVRLNVYLTRNGVRTDDYRTTNAERNWYWIFRDLPKYENGQEIVYGFEEEEVEGYDRVGDAVAIDMTTIPAGYGDEGLALTNKHIDETTDVKGSKTWDDANNQDGKRPSEITIKLWATVGASHTLVDTLTVKPDDKGYWTWTFEDLPKYQGGKEITYTITEDAVPGYSTVIDGYNVTNIDTPAKVSVSGMKYWLDANDQDGKRPESITVNLLADGVKIDEKIVTAADDWKWSFTDLDEYKNGTKILYTITENPVKDYVSFVDQYDLINTHITETVEFSGQKTWNDANDQDGKRPASITIRLWKSVDGKDTELRTAIVTAARNWKWSFVNLPKYEGGKPITYFITEDKVDDYVAHVDGFNVTNTHEAETIDITGGKTWNDSNNQDGKRPVYITINLLADGVKVAAMRVTEENDWKWSFADMPKYKGGKEITYTITEDKVEGYTTTIDGYDVTNTHVTEVTAVNGYKVWEDDNNRDLMRPDSIVINLLANGKEIAEKTVTAGNGWMWSFTDLPKYEGGKEIKYTITEDPVEGYTAQVDGYIVTNSHHTLQLAAAGVKVWQDARNRSGIRPTEIVLHLLADGVEIAAKTVDATTDWSYDFGMVPKYDHGREIVYTIIEEPVAGYAAMAYGFGLTNTEVVHINGSKTWVDNSNSANARPASIVINLLADGVEVDEVTVTAEDDWSWSFAFLPKYNEKDEEIVYTITEDKVPGYITEIDGYDVINRFDSTDFTVTKLWEGGNGGEISLTLYANGERITPQPVYDRMDDVYRWNDLPKYDADGKEIVYSATERYMDGYMTIYKNYGDYADETKAVYDGGEIINRKVTSVYVRKVWSGLAEGEAKPEITLTLYCNGEKVDKKTPEPDEHGWYRYYNLPVTKNGQPAVYTVAEEPLDGFIVTYQTANGAEADIAHNGDTIVNTRVPKTGDSAPLALWAIMLIVSAAALVVIKRRRA